MATALGRHRTSVVGVNQRSRQSLPLTVDDAMNAVSDWFISMATLCISLSGSSFGAKQTYMYGWFASDRQTPSMHINQTMRTSVPISQCVWLLP
jgi:hypothetical protein